MNHTNNTPRNRIAAARRRAAIVTAAGLVVLAACGSSPSRIRHPTRSARRPRWARWRTPLRLRGGAATGVAGPRRVDAACRRRWWSCDRRRSATPRSSSGRRVLGGDDPPTTTDHYRIGSLTKTMTATVILQLAQEGKLSLDDPISKYRPDVPNGDTITIAQLLDMRSGLYGYDLDPVFLRAVDADPKRIWSPDDLLAIGYSKPALFAPGTAYDYSNTNYVLLGLVMEQVTGKTASELFQERLFDPLGLDSTLLPALDDASIPSVFAHGYQFTSAEQAGGTDPALTAEQQQAAADGELLPTDWSAANPSGAGPPDR